MVNRPKKIHFVGIKGVGMAPLAIIAKEARIQVSGSDVEEVFITDGELRAAGIDPLPGFDPSRVSGVDLVIATSAHQGRENPEVLAARKLGIEVLTQGEALAKFQTGELLNRNLKGISVAGSHGKTTTTSIIATMLKEAGLDPSYSIGTGEIPTLGSSGHFGKGEYFVAEADEYVVDALSDKTPKFLLMKPKYSVVTNIDYDHPDVYASMEVMRKAFVEFSDKVTSDGALIACGDGEENRKFLSEVLTRKITYGSSPTNDFSLQRLSFSEDKMFFWVNSRGTLLGDFSMKVFGEHNAINALSAIALGLEIGLSLEQIKKGLSVFKGSKRRSEFIGQLENGALLYDDYGHHPAEIKATLRSFRTAFPKKRIICVFQPHMYSRTKTLFDDFSRAFIDCDLVIIPEIFPSFREEADPDFSSSLLVTEVKKHSKEALYFPTFTDVVKYLTSQKMDRNTLILTMGAGDVYKIGQLIMEEDKNG